MTAAQLLVASEKQPYALALRMLPYLSFGTQTCGRQPAPCKMIQSNSQWNRPTDRWKTFVAGSLIDLELVSNAQLRLRLANAAGSNGNKRKAIISRQVHGKGTSSGEHQLGTGLAGHAITDRSIFVSKLASCIEAFRGGSSVTSKVRRTL